MALIDRLVIESFHCFDKLVVEGLTRINLVVGKNNSGKTTLLRYVAASRGTSGGTTEFMDSAVPNAQSLERLFLEPMGWGLRAYADEAVGIVDGRVGSVAAANETDRIRPAEIVARIRGSYRRFPVTSLGDGTIRILGIALACKNARGGVLLIDSLENGLHCSVMPRFWRFLVKTARELNVQVFATTHSKDLLESLSILHGESPELAQDVSVHRLTIGVDKTFRLSASEVGLALDTGMDPRGWE
mgnify:CR=1 FL=1